MTLLGMSLLAIILHKNYINCDWMNNVIETTNPPALITLAMHQMATFMSLAITVVETSLVDPVVAALGHHPLAAPVAVLVVVVLGIRFLPATQLDVTARLCQPLLRSWRANPLKSILLFLLSAVRSLSPAWLLELLVLRLSSALRVPLCTPFHFNLIHVMVSFNFQSYLSIPLLFMDRECLFILS
jgi:hypothetical protein